MYALITDGSIAKYLNGNKAITIGEIQYPRNIFTLWTASEKAAIGIIEVTFDDSNKKDNTYYINTGQTYTYDADAGTVTAAFGDATAKAHADTTWSQQDSDDGDLPSDKSVGDIKTRGLKYNLIQTLKSQVAGILNETDWYITRNAEKSTAIPSAISTHRDAVRTKQAQMETAITNASNTPALETLYTFTKQEDNTVTRPLGELPTLEI